MRIDGPLGASPERLAFLKAFPFWMNHLQPGHLSLAACDARLVVASIDGVEVRLDKEPVTVSKMRTFRWAERYGLIEWADPADRQQNYTISERGAIWVLKAEAPSLRPSAAKALADLAATAPGKGPSNYWFCRRYGEAALDELCAHNLVQLAVCGTSISGYHIGCSISDAGRQWLALKKYQFFRKGNHN